MYQVSLTQKKEYVVIPITSIGHTFTFKIKQPYLSSYWQNITEIIFNPWNFLITKIWNERRNKIKMIFVSSIAILRKILYVN